MNVWTFSGRVGADAELRKTQSGEFVLSFRVANDIGFGDKRTSQWADCSYWGKRAEAVANYVKKGDKIVISGELRLEEFTRRDGTPGSKLSVRVNDLDLASRQGEGGDQRQGGGYGSRASADDVNRPLGNERGGAAGRGGGKPAFDPDLDDTVPF